MITIQTEDRPNIVDPSQKEVMSVLALLGIDSTAAVFLSDYPDHLTRESSIVVVRESPTEEYYLVYTPEVEQPDNVLVSSDLNLEQIVSLVARFDAGATDFEELAPIAVKEDSESSDLSSKQILEWTSYLPKVWKVFVAIVVIWYAIMLYKEF